MATLTPIAIEHLKKKSSLRLKIMGTINASHNTMMKYLEVNDIRLTAIDALNIIVEDMQIPLSEVITGEKLSKLMLK